MATIRPLFDLQHININDVKNSKKWFDEKIKHMAKSGATPNRVMSSAGSNLTFKIQPGQLYFFHYDPKFKDKLPYYDTFPLVIPYKAVAGGFLGLNLHYLGYKERFALFKKLLQLNSSNLDDLTKIKYSWSVVSQFSNLLGVDKCIKMYLYDHLASPLSKVQPHDFTTAIFLPVEKFVGSTKQQVWNQR
jgi:hypothetical protein